MERLLFGRRPSTHGKDRQQCHSDIGDTEAGQSGHRPGESVNFGKERLRLGPAVRTFVEET
jgi:hypothetical protein